MDYLTRTGDYRKSELFTLCTILCIGVERFGRRVLLSSHHGGLWGRLLTSSRNCRLRLMEVGDGGYEVVIRCLERSRGHLGELLSDLEVWMLSSGHAIWSSEDNEYLSMMGVSFDRFESGTDILFDSGAYVMRQEAKFRGWLDHGDSSVVGNALLVLIRRGFSLMNRELCQRREELRLMDRGLGYRASEPEVSPDSPLCPVCGSGMRLRTAKSGKNAGSQFWGCTQYPNCCGTREVEEDD